MLQLHLPASLTPLQRAVIHEAAEEHGIPHSSSGQDSTRHITLGDEQAKEVSGTKVLALQNACNASELRNCFSIFEVQHSEP